MAIKVEGFKQLKKSFEFEIETLSRIAADLEMKETATKLSKIKESLISDCFRVLVVGNFMVGKTTLVNALLGQPSELFEPNVCLIDSPRTNRQDQIVGQLAENADVLIVVFNSRAFASQDELESVQNMVGNTIPFYVVNMWDGVEPDERFKGYVWNRLVTDWQGGPKYTGQEFSSRNIFLVNTLKAERGKLTGNTTLVNESGLSDLEQFLSVFLEGEPQRKYLLKFFMDVVQQAAAIEENITRQWNALPHGDQIRKAYEDFTNIYSKEIRRRKDRLPGVMDKYQSDAQRELKLGFKRVFNRLEANLPSALEGYKLPSAGGFLSMFKKQKMGNEAAAFCADYIERELKQWGGKNGDAQKALKKVLDSMIEEVASEITRIERKYQDIHIEMSGMGTTSGTQVGPGMADRILSNFIGIASNIISALELILAAFLGAIQSRGLVIHLTVVRDAKLSILYRILDGDRTTNPPTPPLHDLRLKVDTQIDEELARHFRDFRVGLMNKVEAAIRDEEAAIETLIWDSFRRIDESLEISNKLESSRVTVAGVRTRLNKLRASSDFSFIREQLNKGFLLYRDLL